MRDEGRAPRLIALENVLGLLASKGGADFAALCRALADLGYRFGALTIDAAHFVPQSRPRLFLVALADEIAPPGELTAPGPVAPYAAPALRRAVDALPAALAARWLWWRLPPPPRVNRTLIDCLDAAPDDAPWLSASQTQALLAALSKASRVELRDRARAAGERRVAALFRRTRADGVRAEARFDGLAGCLRTPAGGSSRQFLLDVEGGTARARLIGAREAARLMGLPDSYRLPARRNEAYHLLGDGVVAPVVQFLSESLLLPLVEAGRIERATACPAALAGGRRLADGEAPTSRSPEARVDRGAARWPRRLRCATRVEVERRAMPQIRKPSPSAPPSCGR